MLQRAFFGILKGLLLGGITAAAVVYALHAATFGALLAYAAAALTGALTGLVTGKPLWAPGAKIEASLKGVVGALLGMAMLFGIRKWFGWQLDLSAFGAGSGNVGDLPLAALPLIGGATGLLFELDNTGTTTPPAVRKRVDEDRQERALPDSVGDDELGARASSARRKH